MLIKRNITLAAGNECFLLFGTNTHTHIQTEVEHNLSMAATGITSHGMDPSFSGPFAARAHYSRQYFVAIDHEINRLPPRGNRAGT